MDNKQILEKAFDKILQSNNIPYGYTMGELLEDIPTLQRFAKVLWGEWRNDINCKVCEFQHELYNEDQYKPELDDPWKFHLTQMVIADDPIKYLGENI